MSDMTLTRFFRPQRGILPGLGLALLLGSIATALGQQAAFVRLGLGALTLAIALGIVFGNLFLSWTRRECDAGIAFSKQYLLRLGIVLYGFRLTVQQIAEVGASGVAIDVLTLSTTFLLACWLGRRVFGLDRETVWLIGAGSSICGAAAILATEPLIKADAAKVAVAIATVVLFGTLAMFVYPLLYPVACAFLPVITPVSWGIYTGSTLHEVAQVVAAGHAVNADTENAAVIAKMLRVMMLAPFLLIFSRRGAGKMHFPWFALLFIAVALFNSLHWLPPQATAAIAGIDNLLLATAMAALGLTTRLSDLRNAGVKPLLLGGALFLWLTIGGGAINLALGDLLS